MTLYADYDYYISVYGGEMSESAFDKHVRTASAYIKRITLGRADKQPELDELKYACCAMCDAIEITQTAQQDGRSIKSVSNDGYSVSYVTEADGTTAEQALNAKLYDIAAMYLTCTGLLKRQVAHCVY